MLMRVYSVVYVKVSNELIKPLRTHKIERIIHTDTKIEQFQGCCLSGTNLV